ncbi:MAG: transcriptional regulator [Deltaproteobacteria bacterium]|nr:transcriptional regulator [Deltaproteobacteria bacterium]
MPRGDQISRQWQILQILEARRAGVSVPDLALELESNVRTIYRDMEAIEIAGFPIYNEKEDGVERWKFVEGYRNKIPIPLEMTELMALAIAKDHLNAFDGTVFSGSLHQAFEKIQATLKPEAHSFLEGLSKSFRVGLTGRKDYRKHRETIDLINKAVLEQKTAVIRYRPMKGDEGDRRIDPYYVWFMGGTIYIVAYCHERKEIRLYLLDRIAKARLTEDHFKVPSDFSIEEFTSGRFRVMGGEPTDVRIRFDSYIAPYVKERTWHPSQQLEEMKDGSVVLSMNVEGIEEIRSWVLSFGSHAEVMGPDRFRKEVAVEIRSAGKRYL